MAAEVARPLHSSWPRCRALPGEERAVADAVVPLSARLGLTVDEDDAGARVGSNDGNIYCRARADAAAAAASSSAPISTPCRRPAPIEPVVEDGVVRNAAGRSSAPTTSRRSRRCSRARAACSPRTGRTRASSSLFTPKEEVGLHRRRRVRPRRASHARLGYVYDQAAPIGEVDPRRAVLAGACEVRFHGRAAHSGMYPEEGRSAIAAAARAIADLRLGRVDEETTANVGIDPGRHGREHRPRVVHVRRRGALARRAQARRPRAGDARRVHVRGRLADCEVETKVRKSYRGYRFKRATTGRPARRTTRSSGAATRRATALAAAPPTRTSSTNAGCRASTSRTG